MVLKQRTQFCKFLVVQKVQTAKGLNHFERHSIIEVYICNNAKTSTLRSTGNMGVSTCSVQILKLKSFWARFIPPQQFYTPSTVWHSLNASSCARGTNAAFRVKLCRCTLQTHCQWCPSPREGSHRPTARLGWGSQATPSPLQISGREVGPFPVKSHQMLGAGGGAVIRSQHFLDLPFLLQITQSFLYLGHLWEHKRSSATWLPPQTLFLQTGWQCGWRCVRSSRRCANCHPDRAEVSHRGPAGRGGSNCLASPLWSRHLVSRRSAGGRRACFSPELVGWSLSNRSLWTQGSPTPAEGEKPMLTGLNAWA